MDEDLSIINTNTRNEKIKNFFVNNKNKIISGIIILIIIIVGVFSYDKYLINKKKDISDSYNSIIIDYSEKTKEKTASSLIEIINKKDPTYSPLSLYFIIDNNLVTDQSKINSLFDILIKDTSSDSEINNLIIYKKALFNSDNALFFSLLLLFTPLFLSTTVSLSHSLSLFSPYFYPIIPIQKSTAFFNQIISFVNSNPDIRLQSERRLNRHLI